VRRGAVDANVAAILEGTDEHERFAGRRVPALAIHRLKGRRRCTAQRDRDGMPPGVTRFQRHLSAVAVRRLSVVMFVYSGAVVMLGVIVRVVGVRVQPRRHAGRRRQCRDEQQRQHAVHGLSVLRGDQGRQTWPEITVRTRRSRAIRCGRIGNDRAQSSGARS
jgi:hypothetical protein